MRTVIGFTVFDKMLASNPGIRSDLSFFNQNPAATTLHFIPIFVMLSTPKPTTPQPVSILFAYGSEVQPISVALRELDLLRAEQLAHPELVQAVLTIKRAQVHRFRKSYADVLTHPDWGSAAHFFLQELYGDKDYSQRDSEFSRIAPALQRLFPKSVVTVAATLVHLHVLSEKLDHAMAIAMLVQASTPLTATIALQNYVRTWRSVGQWPARTQQIELVQALGSSLAKLTRSSSLRMMLRMMRTPAHAAGLQHLQDFLERGFEVFAALQHSNAGVNGFLTLVNERENAWANRLFSDPDTNANGRSGWPELE